MTTPRRAGAGLVALAFVLLAAGACNLELLNEQGQGEPETVVAPTVVPTPSGPSLDQIERVELEKADLGACNTDANKISSSCPDLALLTCRAIGTDGQVLASGFEPAWFGQTPVTVTSSNVNQWNARATCNPPGQTGSVICAVRVVGGDPTANRSDEEFYECVP